MKPTSKAKYLLTDVNTTIENLKLCMDNFSIYEYIDESVNEILIYKYKEMNNGYIINILNALIYHNVYTTFCNDLEIALSFNYDGKVYPCTKLNGKCSLGNKELCDINNKALYTCSNCWAKNFCTGCAAAYYLKEQYIPESVEKCKKRNGYEYAFDKLMWFYHYEPEKFQQIIDNFLL